MISHQLYQSLSNIQQSTKNLRKKQKMIMKELQLSKEMLLKDKVN